MNFSRFYLFLVFASTLSSLLVEATKMSPFIRQPLSLIVPPDTCAQLDKLYYVFIADIINIPKVEIVHLVLGTERTRAMVKGLVRQCEAMVGTSIHELISDYMFLYVYDYLYSSALASCKVYPRGMQRKARSLRMAIEKDANLLTTAEYLKVVNIEVSMISEYKHGLDPNCAVSPAFVVNVATDRARIIMEGLTRTIEAYHRVSQESFFSGVEKKIMEILTYTQKEWKAIWQLGMRTFVDYPDNNGVSGTKLESFKSARVSQSLVLATEEANKLQELSFLSVPIKRACFYQLHADNNTLSASPLVQGIANILFERDNILMAAELYSRTLIMEQAALNLQFLNNYMLDDIDDDDDDDGADPAGDECIAKAWFKYSRSMEALCACPFSSDCLASRLYIQFAITVFEYDRLVDINRVSKSSTSSGYEFLKMHIDPSKEGYLKSVIDVHKVLQSFNRNSSSLESLIWKVRSFITWRLLDSQFIKEHIL